LRKNKTVILLLYFEFVNRVMVAHRRMHFNLVF